MSPSYFPSGSHPPTAPLASSMRNWTQIALPSVPRFVFLCLRITMLFFPNMRRAFLADIFDLCLMSCTFAKRRLRVLHSVVRIYSMRDLGCEEERLISVHCCLRMMFTDGMSHMTGGTGWKGWWDNNKTGAATGGVGARATRMGVCHVVVGVDAVSSGRARS